MNQAKINKHLIAGILIGALIVYFLSTYTTNKKLTEFQASLETAIEAELTETVVQAQNLARGNTTASIEKIISDCKPEERQIFESNLAKLDNNITTSELAEVDLLFGRCAPTSALRRTLMAINLERSVQNLNSLTSQRKTLSNFEVNDDILGTLNSVVVLENRIAELSLDLVYLQREIIDELVAGRSSDSDSLTNLKQQGLTIRNEIETISTEAKPYRDLLSNS